MRSDGTRSERSQDDSGDFRIESGPSEGRAGRGVGQQLPAAFAPLAEVRALGAEGYELLDIL
ncbi:hypothetical protein F8M49_08160 [Rhodococcus zopfii]|uniref:Uncharacterized protein n=1 Tax=Rhodococcus zopfii TaxID=43772 RepID=A0ABU3WN23_9NOCA|nr:hypothetical protein [Rhodococcus zopfii]